MFTVLWIDDRHDHENIFKKQAKKLGIQLVCVDNYISGEKWIEANKTICRAVILDVECKLASDSNSANIETFRTRADITRLCNIYKIPLYIFTGYDADKINEMLHWSNETAYFKADSAFFLRKLVSDLENSTIGQLEKKYSKILEFAAPKKEELLRVMLGIKQGDYMNNGLLNEMRKVLEWLICGYLYEYGLNSFQEISLADARYYLLHVNEENNSILPDYIRYSIQACENAVQEGSHADLRVDKDVKSGDAPYLIESTFNNLLNILCWAKSLPQDEVKKNEILHVINSICKTTPINEVGLVKQDSNGTYYINECKINPRNGEDLTNRTIRINSWGLNNKHKDTYTYFTKDYDILS